jgi:predicted amidohydrolase
MRHIAIESGAFVVSAPQYIPASAFPDDFPVELPAGKEVFGRGGAAIVDPEWGDLIAGPLYDKEGLVLADCDLRRGLRAKRWFDAVGHYSRSDVLGGGAGVVLAGGGNGSPASAAAPVASPSPSPSASLEHPGPTR